MQSTAKMVKRRGPLLIMCTCGPDGTMRQVEAQKLRRSRRRRLHEFNRCLYCGKEWPTVRTHHRCDRVTLQPSTR